MESKAKLVDVSKDWKSGKTKLTFLLDKELSGDVIAALAEKVLRLTAVVWRKKRSLNANAYFHVLCGKIADARTLDGDTITKTHQKNEMICLYGQPMILENGDPLTFKTNVPPETICEWEDERHYKYIKTAIENGKPTYFYEAYYGSRFYDSREMAALIAGTVEVAKKYGIDTATPNEIAHMTTLWEKEKERLKKAS